MHISLTVAIRHLEWWAAHDTDVSSLKVFQIRTYK